MQASHENLPELADAAVRSLGRELVGEKWKKRGAGKARVRSVFHYGAVDLDPSHLVVWVVLDGPEERLPPPWWSTDSETAAPADPELADWLKGIAARVRAVFAERGWPDAGHVRVMVESNERVEREGGFQYFR